MSRLAVVLVVCLVAMAGCSGLSGGDGPPDREPYGVDERVNASVEDEPEELLPGLTTERLTNSEELREAHESVIGNRSYTIEIETEYVIEHENGTFRRTSGTDLHVDPEAGVIHEVASHRVESDVPDSNPYAIGGNRTVERWFGEEILFATEFENGTVEYTQPQYATGQAYDRTDQASTRLFVPLQSIEEPTVAGAVDSEEGTYYVVEGEENLSEDELGSNRREGTLEARTLVREDGLVRQTVAGQDSVDGEGDRTVINQTVEITAIGGTEVQRPDWYEEAIEAQPERPEPEAPADEDGANEADGNGSVDRGERSDDGADADEPNDTDG